MVARRAWSPEARVQFSPVVLNVERRRKMACDFLDVDDDANGSSVLLSMKASGDAFLTIIGSENAEDYHLTPNEIGWKNACKIVDALKAWIDHTRTIKGGV